MGGLAILRAIVAFLGGIRATVFFVLLLLAIAGGKFWMHRAHKYEAERDAIKATHAASIAIWNAEIDRLTRDLASAKEAGEKAVAEKAAAEKAAAKRLAQARKDWEKLYGSKPENRAWADSPLPPDVRNRLSRPRSP